MASATVTRRLPASSALTAPSELAQVYADVIRIRIAGLSDRRLKCAPVNINELAYPDDRPYDPRD